LQILTFFCKLIRYIEIKKTNLGFRQEFYPQEM
jgi:hypothetical protein